MVKVTFITANEERVEAQAEPGDNLLRVGQAAGMPLEGTCEGQMACSTCHVIVAREWFAKLPRASEDEEDLLDLAAGVRPTSRLSCQIEVTEELNGIEVRIPGDSHDMRRR
ncbi:MAG: 2Fe-2S iron-sulfur cluster-binding protein [Novosphingobium sp.]